ncbi:hypothetical protein SDJN03_04946, partial [Cucurbita argyrosperma subsp. sororia]
MRDDSCPQSRRRRQELRKKLLNFPLTDGFWAYRIIVRLHGERESSRAAEQTTRYFSADATAIFITNHLSLSLFRSPALGFSFLLSTTSPFSDSISGLDGGGVLSSFRYQWVSLSVLGICCQCSLFTGLHDIELGGGGLNILWFEEHFLRQVRLKKLLLTWYSGFCFRAILGPVAKLVLEVSMVEFFYQW